MSFLKFILVVTALISIANCQEKNSEITIQNKTLITTPASISQKDDKQLQDSLDQLNEIYVNFIENLLEDEEFFNEALYSVSNVLYNQWIINLPINSQKKYLKILLTTVQNDGTGATPEQYFQILQKILEDEKISNEFFSSFKFDFKSQQFKDFIIKQYPSQSKIDFQNLTYEQKAKMYLLALQKQNQLQNQKKEKHNLINFTSDLTS